MRLVPVHGNTSRRAQIESVVRQQQEVRNEGDAEIQPAEACGAQCACQPRQQQEWDEVRGKLQRVEGRNVFAQRIQRSGHGEGPVGEIGRQGAPHHQQGCSVRSRPGRGDEACVTGLAAYSIATVVFSLL